MKTNFLTSIHAFMGMCKQRMIFFMAVSKLLFHKLYSSWCSVTHSRNNYHNCYIPYCPRQAPIPHTQPSPHTPYPGKGPYPIPGQAPIPSQALCQVIKLHSRATLSNVLLMRVLDITGILWF